MANYKNLSGTEQVKPMSGQIFGIFISSSSSGTITIYDSSASLDTDPKIIDTFSATEATNFNFYKGLYANKGIYVVITGTLSCTIAYE